MKITSHGKVVRVRKRPTRLSRASRAKASNRHGNVSAEATDHPDAIVKRTGKYGRGVFAKQRIPKGTRIATFDGPIYDDKTDPWTQDMLDHAIQFAKNKWRDSDGIARLINHSCDPNCGIKNLFDIVAMRDIEAGEQITWDYEMTEKSWWMKMPCRCGSPLCRKVIGNYARMPKEVRRRYRGFISSWLTQPSVESKSRSLSSKHGKSSI